MIEDAAVYVVCYGIISTLNKKGRFPIDDVDCICVQLWAERMGLA